jgi:hypothetical protein
MKIGLKNVFWIRAAALQITLVLVMLEEGGIATILETRKLASKMQIIKMQTPLVWDQFFLLSQ